MSKEIDLLSKLFSLCHKGSFGCFIIALEARIEKPIIIDCIKEAINATEKKEVPA